MTVVNEASLITYQANGTTTNFAVPFKFFDKELAVYVNKTFTTYEKDVDYTITGAGNPQGGEIVFKEAPAVGIYITISRDVVLNQMVKFIEGEDFPAADYEYSLDRVIMALQEFMQKLRHCVQFPLGADDWDTFAASLLKMNYQGQQQTYWREDYPYGIGELTRYNEYWWLSLYDSNKGNKPGNSSPYWSKFAIYDSYTTNEIDNKLTLKADLADVYTKEEVDGKIPVVPPVIKASDVSFGNWAEDSYLEGYSYSATATLPGVTAGMIPIVAFNPSDAESGNLAPIATAYDNTVKIFAKTQPEAAIVAASVICQ